MYTQSIDHSPDVLIVGAGVSGLFAAYRLLEQTPNLKVVIVDKLNRTGGRLQTTTVPICGTDGIVYDVKNEEGGMRFVPDGAGMANLWQLISSLGLEDVAFPMGNEHQNRYFFRGQSFTKDKTPAVWKTIFNLAPEEQDKQPTDIFTEVMAEILSQNKDRYNAEDNKTFPSTPEEWILFRNTFTYNGIVINNWGFWALLRDYGLTPRVY